MHIGLGTAAIGRPHYINIKSQTTSEPFEKDLFVKKGVEVLEAAYKAGVRYFDTAPGYGIAEEIIGEWHNQFNHSDYELATKWGYKYVANFNPKATIHEVKEHSLAMLNEQWDFSKKLSRLNTLQIHSATLETGVLENQKVIERLREIKENEKIKIGLTTSGVNQNQIISRALDIEADEQPLFDVFQVTYNVLDQSLANLIEEMKDRRIIIKEALANGRLFRNTSYPHYQELYDFQEKLARKYDVGVDAINLRFALDSISPYAVLSGAASPQQIRENCQASLFKFEESEMSAFFQYGINPQDYWEERKQLVWN